MNKEEIKELKEGLGIDSWLELVKEDKNLNGAYISFAQYIHILEQENQQLQQRIEKAIEYVKNEIYEYDYYNQLNMILKGEEK